MINEEEIKNQIVACNSIEELSEYATILEKLFDTTKAKSKHLRFGENYQKYRDPDNYNLFKFLGENSHLFKIEENDDDFIPNHRAVESAQKTISYIWNKNGGKICPFAVESSCTGCITIDFEDLRFPISSWVFDNPTAGLFPIIHMRSYIRKNKDEPGLIDRKTILHACDAYEHYISFAEHNLVDV